MFVPRDAAAFFTLPTGPSENEGPAAVAPATAAPGTIPAGVRVLVDGEFQAALESGIAAACSEIILGAYIFSARDALAKRPRAVAERLAEAAARGVKVEVILEIGRESEAVTRINRATARMLAQRGIKVFVDGSGTVVHARFVVIDRRLVFIGSHDLTQTSLGQYREVSLLVDSAAVAALLLRQVESLKATAYVEASPPPSPPSPPKRVVRSRTNRSR